VARPPRNPALQPSAEELAHRRAVLADIRATGFFRRGTLLQIHNRCGTDTCSCHDYPPRLHGPYWQWTRKVQGKTVTVRLSEAQATLLRGWLDNGRQLDQKLADFEKLSSQVTDRLLRAAARPSR